MLHLSYEEGNTIVKLVKLVKPKIKNSLSNLAGITQKRALKASFIYFGKVNVWFPSAKSKTRTRLDWVFLAYFKSGLPEIS